MVTLSQKFGQLKQWTGEKFGKSTKTEKPVEIKKLKCETQATFQRIKSFRNNLKEYAQSLDQEKESSLLQLSKNVDSLAIIHADDELGPNFAVFAESMANISAAQDEFANNINMGLLMHLEAILNDEAKFDNLRSKLKTRRLDFDANQNKLFKSKTENTELEEQARNTQQKYEESLKSLESLMISIMQQESSLLPAIADYAEHQKQYYQSCLNISNNFLKHINDRNDANLATKDKNNNDPLLEVVVAKYSFDAESDNELSILPGDQIEVLKKVNDGWWLGKCKDRRGLFPVNYVIPLDTRNESRLSNSDAATNLSPLCSPSDKPRVSEIKSKGAEEVNAASTAARPGFSYLPQGLPISFIGKKSNSGPEGEAPSQVDKTCSDCGCEDFVANVFKPGCCNNCFHKH